MPSSELTFSAILIVSVAFKCMNYAFSAILQNIVNNATPIFKGSEKQ